MEDSKKILLNNTVLYALILGGILILMDLIFYILNVSMLSHLRKIYFLIIIGVMIYGTVLYRNKYKKGYLTYGQSFLFGFLLVLFASVLFSLYSYFFIKFINTNYINEVMDMTRETLIKKGLDEEQVEKMIETQSKFITPLFISLGTIISNLFYGTIVSLIVSIFIKKEDKSFKNTINTELNNN